MALSEEDIEKMVEISVKKGKELRKLIKWMYTLLNMRKLES
jgi:hypothetical protein